MAQQQMDDDIDDLSSDDGFAPPLGRAIAHSPQPLVAQQQQSELLCPFVLVSIVTSISASVPRKICNSDKMSAAQSLPTILLSDAISIHRPTDKIGYGPIGTSPFQLKSSFLHQKPP